MAVFVLIVRVPSHKRQPRTDLKKSKHSILPSRIPNRVNELIQPGSLSFLQWSWFLVPPRLIDICGHCCSSGCGDQQGCRKELAQLCRGSASGVNSRPGNQRPADSIQLDAFAATQSVAKRRLERRIEMLAAGNRSSKCKDGGEGEGRALRLCFLSIRRGDCRVSINTLRCPC